MQFTNLQQFFNMGGYALYVWTAYGLVFSLLFINLIKTCLHQRRIKQQLKRYLNSNKINLTSRH